jgi:Na+-driven multidrug efflux pump
MVAFSVLILAWASGVIHIFSSDPDLDAVASAYIRIAAVGYMVGAFSMVLQQCIAGAGDTIPPMVISIASIWLLQIPLSIFLPKWHGLGLYGVRWAMVAGAVVAAVAYTIYYRRGRWKRKRL